MRRETWRFFCSQSRARCVPTISAHTYPKKESYCRTSTRPGRDWTRLNMKGSFLWERSLSGLHGFVYFFFLPQDKKSDLQKLWFVLELQGLPDVFLHCVMCVTLEEKVITSHVWFMSVILFCLYLRSGVCRLLCHLFHISVQYVSDGRAWW